MNKRLEQLTKTEIGQIEIWKTLLAEEFDGDRSKLDWEKIAEELFISNHDNAVMLDYLTKKITALYFYKENAVEQKQR